MATCESQFLKWHPKDFIGFLPSADRLRSQTWVLSHRVSLHNELKRLATLPTGQGPPAVLKTASRVVAIDPETATITLNDGTTFAGDLVLGADGVSVSRGLATLPLFYPVL